MATASELTIQTFTNRTTAAQQLAQTIFGSDVNVISASYDGDLDSVGIYSGGDATAPGITPSDVGAIFSTGEVEDVTNSAGDPNVRGNTSTNTSGDNNDPDFNALAGAATADASFLEATFTTNSPFLSIQFTFGSEEYPEFVNSIYNDVVGVWINGTEVASPVFQTTQISTLNENQNETLYNDNTGDAFNTEMDGFTVTLSLIIPVSTTGTNTIKLGIADVGDSFYDSTLMIAADSIQGVFLARDDAETVFEGQTANVDVLANDDNVGVAFVTHVNGQEILPNGSVTLNSGHVVTLLLDGTLDIQPPASQVNLTDPESINFSYTADDGSGISDTAFVTVTAIPCFARGTLIRTETGERRVQDLKVGDMVHTRDDGLQPVRWAGRKLVAADGALAPVVIEAGTFGRHRRLILSPQHRVMVQHHMAELMFGEDEVLVAAKDLVNGVSIWSMQGGFVEYHHLLFDRHQMIWSDGLLTESFLPGPNTMPGFDDGVQAEIYELFPELREDAAAGYGGAARRGLKAFEARALLG
ncbi:MAG: Hint domain-containing protein [Pseudomonadota bacterium]